MLTWKCNIQVYINNSRNFDGTLSAFFKLYPLPNCSGDDDDEYKTAQSPVSED